MPKGKGSHRVRVVTGHPDVALSKDEFVARFRARFYDPAFEAEKASVDRLAEVAWKAYEEDRKSPRTRKAGTGFADPDYDLPIEWLETRERIAAAERRRAEPSSPTRVLVVNGSSRTDRSCPGEASKSFRLARHACDAIERRPKHEVDFLDLSVLVSEYGRVVYPCKACVSTAQPLCHWPCSCYPNHGQGQAGDWMNELYPRFAAAHALLFVTAVHWYQAPSVLKLVIDRLVCADGGNPDLTSTQGKDPKRAKELELAGWDYPKHLGGRAFGVFVHGDAAGAESLRRGLVDWLTDMGLVPAGPHAGVDRYVGYYEPYATSHDALDADRAIWKEVENLALAVAERAVQIRTGRYRRSDEGLSPPRQK
jgi:multimeric flavodoxin WrbA